MCIRDSILLVPVERLTAAVRKQDPLTARIDGRPQRLLLPARHIELLLKHAQGFTHHRMPVSYTHLGLLQFTSARPLAAFQTWQPLESLGDRHCLVLFKRAFAALAIDAFDDALLLLDQGIALNDDNAPLNHDMRMVAAHIQSLRADPGATPPAEQDEAATQFVLASYKQNL